MANVYVYIDGFNLYYGAVKDSPYRWLDLGALCAHMLLNDTVQSIKYFTAIVSARPHDPQQPRSPTDLLAGAAHNSAPFDHFRPLPDAFLPHGSVRNESATKSVG